MEFEVASNGAPILYLARDGVPGANCKYSGRPMLRAALYWQSFGMSGADTRSADRALDFARGDLRAPQRIDYPA